MDGFASVFLACEDTHLAGYLEASLRAVAALACIGVVILGGSLVMALLTLPIVALMKLLVAYLLVTRKYGRPRLYATRPYFSRTIRESLPYALSNLLSQISSRTDVVLLGFFLGAAAAGIYNVAYRIIFLLLFLPNFIGLSVLPFASRAYKNSLEEFKLLYAKSLNIMILIALPTACGLFLVAEDIIPLIYGDNFQQSIIILRILCAFLLIFFVRWIFGIFLICCDRQIERTKSQWKSALVNVSANLILIPIIGIKGAAIAALISEIVLVTLLAFQIKEVVGWPPVGSRLVISALATVSFCLPFAIFSSVSPFVVIPSSLVIYLAVLSSFNKIRKNEFSIIANLLR